MDSLNEIALLRQKLLGTQNNYDAFTKLQQLELKNIRKPTYYSKPAEEQLKMDVKLLKEQIRQLNKLQPPIEVYKLLPMLGYGPGYTLLVHHLYFRAYQKFATPSFKDKQRIKRMQILGGVFDKRVKTNLSKVQNTNIKGIITDKVLKIQMDTQQWFYSRMTSVHISAAVVLVQANKQTIPVYIKLRDQKGQLFENVKTKFFGYNISSQHFIIGFNLNNYMVSSDNFLNSGWKEQSAKQIRNQIQRIQLFLSLQDLYKSCYITIRYTSMRRQFRTIQESKQQRRIIQYQGVSSRIAEGLATVFMICSLLANGKPGFADYYQYGHKVIFNQLVTLRECCGGFGYLKASGHPLLIQRGALRTSQTDHHPIFPIPKQTIKQYSPYVTTSDSNVKFQYSQHHPKTPQNYYMISAQYHFLQPKTSAQQSQYVYDFVKCCGIQQFQKTETWNSFRTGVTNVIDLCRYICVVEGLKDSKYINMKITKQKTKEEVLQSMIQLKRDALRSISKSFQKFNDCLPVLGMQDAILGRDDQNEFYEEVLKVSKQGHRNSKQFIDEVKKPIVQYLTNGNLGNL